MSRCLELAAKGKGFVSPNPMVGCVIVRDGEVLSEGYHSEFGGPHAEVAAMQSVDDLTGATLYVNLIPCCHEGKTPPCTELIIQSAIKHEIGRAHV